LALIKLSVANGKRAEIIQLAEVFGAKVMDVGTNTMVLELCGSESKLEDLTNLLEENIIEIAKSGLVSMERGKKISTTKKV
ncbi:MAG: acetolactate synthase small subunit, partial [Spirochaetales bacterium]|nr:acetolactate synthase small subunit [Spirochaetales bacterium]